LLAVVRKALAAWAQRVETDRAERHGPTRSRSAAATETAVPSLLAQ